MAAQGISVFGISVQNESNFTSTTAPTCTYTSSTYDAFMQTFMPIWSTAGLLGNTKIFMPEENDYDFSIAAATLADGTVNADMYGLCCHYYGPATITGPPATPAAGGKLWETEYAHQTSYDASMTDGVVLAQDIHTHLSTGGFNAFLWWQCYWDPAFNTSLVTAPGATPAKRYYVLGNYSKFIRPGWIRIGESDSGGFLCSAYKSPDGSQFAIAAINSTGSSIPVTFTLSGFPSAGFVTPYVTDPSNNLAAQSTISISGGAFTATLGATSVTTFIGGTSNLYSADSGAETDSSLGYGRAGDSGTESESAWWTATILLADAGSGNDGAISWPWDGDFGMDAGGPLGGGGGIGGGGAWDKTFDFLVTPLIGDGPSVTDAAFGRGTGGDSTAGNDGGLASGFGGDSGTGQDSGFLETLTNGEIYSADSGTGLEAFLTQWLGTDIPAAIDAAAE